MKRWQLILPAALCCGLLQPAYARAAEWETGAGIAVGGYYSDNICLAQQDEEDKWVGTARPDVSVRGRGARGNVNLQATAEYNSLGDSSLERLLGPSTTIIVWRLEPPLGVRRQPEIPSKRTSAR